MAKTYCNPLSIPNYPVGRLVRDVNVGEDITDRGGLWISEHKEQWRELADPSVLWHDGKWFLYPSCDMAWVSEDGGATWSHHPLNVRDLGYAPTIVKHREKFLLMGSESAVHVGSSPLGPFAPVEKIELPTGAPGQVDPMLFSDEDGRLFYYWGCTPKSGIWGVELNSEDFHSVIGEPKKLIAFEPEKRPWEKVGDWNENPAAGWLEGAWMFKRQGKYYLTYSAAGTENRTYAMGCTLGSSPLGPFEPQKRNPFLRTTHGLVTGTAHGCIVEGPRQSVWAFYTVRAGVVHGFERRIGMDPVWFEEGEMVVGEASSWPREVGSGRDAGWVPLNVGVRAVGSTTAANLSARLAVDEDLRTWWQPEARDPEPRLECVFRERAVVRAVRICWRDVGLDTTRGRAPGPFQYRVELEMEKGKWVTAVDRTASTEDFLIDYLECEPAPAIAARLVITGWPKGMMPGVAEFTVFGEAG